MSAGELRLLAQQVSKAAGGDALASELKWNHSVSNTHTQTRVLELTITFDLGHLTAATQT